MKNGCFKVISSHYSNSEPILFIYLTLLLAHTYNLIEFLQNLSIGNILIPGPTFS